MPISAERFLSLSTRLGPDDMFSNDFDDAELESLLGHMKSQKVLVIASG